MFVFLFVSAVEATVLLHHYILVYHWCTGNTEVRLVVTDSTKHAFDMYSCLLKSVQIFSDIDSRVQKDSLI